jgi:hypothetical protein
MPPRGAQANKESEPMNKVELKKLLKPLIKECIKEVIFEDGVLSNIVSEVNQGLRVQPLVETRQVPSQTQERNFTEMRQKSAREQKQKVNEHKKQLLEAIGKDAYNGVNLFEGTTPMAPAATAGAPATTHGPLSGVAPHDSGVDITSLMGGVSRHWKAHMDAGK